MITGIVICHGQLAFELVNAMQKILGPVEQLYPLSNDHLTPERLYIQVKEVLERHHGGDHFIFVDLRGGSCWRVAKMLVKEYPALKVISGVNIPMLVSFLSKKHDHRLDELVKIIETDAHRGIVFE